jgi:hypothetical protein
MSPRRPNGGGCRDSGHGNAEQERLRIGTDVFSHPRAPPKHARRQGPPPAQIAPKPRTKVPMTRGGPSATRRPRLLKRISSWFACHDGPSPLIEINHKIFGYFRRIDSMLEIAR